MPFSTARSVQNLPAANISHCDWAKDGRWPSAGRFVHRPPPPEDFLTALRVVTGEWKWSRH